MREWFTLSSNKEAMFADYTNAVESGRPAQAQPQPREFGPISEDFRLFQTGFRTFDPPDRYGEPALKIANEPDMKERHWMTGDSAHGALGRGSALLAIGVGGLVAGTLDLTQACILFGTRVPLVVAAGLLGPKALHGAIGTYILGVLLHFFIAFSATAIYYAASRKLVFLRESPLVCGLFYGATVEVVMGYVVLPLSALHATGPYELRDVLQGLLVHMVVIGLPIAYSVRRFAR
jgi:hypothetical protein